jgi:hypothetical protein
MTTIPSDTSEFERLSSDGDGGTRRFGRGRDRRPVAVLGGGPAGLTAG